MWVSIYLCSRSTLYKISCKALLTRRIPVRGGGCCARRMPYEAPDMQIVHIQIEKGFAQSTTAGNVDVDDSWGDTDWPE